MIRNVHCHNVYCRTYTMAHKNRNTRSILRKYLLEEFFICLDHPKFWFNLLR